MTRILPWSGSDDRSSDALEQALLSVAAPAVTSNTTAASLPATPLTPALARSRWDQETVEDWSRVFLRQLLATDAICATIALALGWLIRFGWGTDALTDAYIFWSVVLTIAWLLCLHAAGAYEIRRISTGAREYQQVLRGCANLIGAVAVVGYLSGIHVARIFVAVVIPVGALLMVLGRYAGRQTVHARRKHGHWTSAILAVGTSESVRHLAEVTSRNPQAGLVVVGACCEDAEKGSELLSGVPVVGDREPGGRSGRSAQRRHRRGCRLGTRAASHPRARLGPRRHRPQHGDGARAHRGRRAASARQPRRGPAADVGRPAAVHRRAAPGEACGGRRRRRADPAPRRARPAVHRGDGAADEPPAPRSTAASGWDRAAARSMCTSSARCTATPTTAATTCWS